MKFPHCDSHLAATSVATKMGNSCLQKKREKLEMWKKLAKTKFSNSLSKGSNDFVTFMLKQISVNDPNIKIFQFEILGQFFGIGLLCHENED